MTRPPAILRPELAKLRRSGFLWVVVAPAFIVGVVVFQAAMWAPSGIAVADLVQSGVATWALFGLPLAASALAALMARTEHEDGAWQHLLAAHPHPAVVIPAKCAVLWLALLLMALLTVAAVLGAAELARLAGASIPGGVDWPTTLAGVARGWTASLLLVTILTATALRFTNPVASLVLGIAGFMTALVTSGRQETWMLPWLLPFKAAAPSAGLSPVLPALVGLAGGIVVGAASMLWLRKPGP